MVYVVVRNVVQESILLKVTSKEFKKELELTGSVIKKL